MKKVLIITLEFPPKIGGISSYIDDLSKNLPAGKVIVLAPKQKESEEFDKFSNYKIYRKKMYWFLWPRWIKLLFLTFFIVRKEKIDQIYIHHTIPVGYVGYILKTIFKIPFLLFLHGADLEVGTKNFWKKYWFVKICKKAENVIVNSEFMKDKLLLKIQSKIEMEKIKILYPCPGEEFLTKKINLQKIELLKDKLSLHGKKVILSVSRLSERKGHVLFANILPKILKRIPNLVWIIVGEGEEEKLIMDVVQKNNLTSVVRFMSSISSPELINYYDLADLFLLFTHKDKHGVEEAWGIAYLEASSRGLPVVAGDSGGVKESVLNNNTGILVNVHEEDKNVKIIADLLSNVENAKYLGENGKKRVQEEFLWSKQIKKIYE